MSKKWVVNIKGGPGSDANFEIAVVREDNAHGRSSYGWFGEDKVLISHSGGPCRQALIPLVWTELVRLAEKVAETMNGWDEEDKKRV